MSWTFLALLYADYPIGGCFLVMLCHNADDWVLPSLSWFQTDTMDEELLFFIIMTLLHHVYVKISEMVLTNLKFFTS